MTRKSLYHDSLNETMDSNNADVSQGQSADCDMNYEEVTIPTVPTPVQKKRRLENSTDIHEHLDSQTVNSVPIRDVASFR